MFTQLKEGREYSFQVGLSSKDILEQQTEEIISYFDSSLHQKKEVLNTQRKDNIDIPISIFQDGESGLKAITHFLRDEKKLSFSQIAILLNRDQRTIWSSYNQELSQDKKNKKSNINSNLKINKNSKKGKTRAIDSKNSQESPSFNNLTINSSLFKERKLSILETITIHLLKNYSVIEIADLLGKNQMTIYTVKQRAEKKIENTRKKITSNYRGKSK